MSISNRFQHAIHRVINGEELSFDEMCACFDVIMEGQATEIQLTSFLIGLKMRGETPTDIAAGAATLRAKATILQDSPEDAIDIVGTGGDGLGTLNISTATSFVLAGAGVPVAKHGNKAVSSKSGAADVLSALGIDVNCSFEAVSQALQDAHIAFLMAPRHHAAMRHVGPVRAELGMRTIFNLLGPLSNPALVKRIMVGVFDAKWGNAFAQALHQLGTTHAWIVHGADGLDELSTTGENQIVSLNNGSITEFTLHPSEIGLNTADISDLIGGSPEQNAAALKDILAGQKNAYRDIVVLNAAGGLVATGHETDLKTAAERATASLDTGAAQQALDRLVQITTVE